MQAGRTSGAAGDKLAALGLATEPSLFIQAPYLRDALGRLECAVESATEWDDRVLVVGRVLHAVDAPAAEPRLHHEWRST